MPRICTRKRVLLPCAGLAIVMAGVQVYGIGPAGAMNAPLASALISLALAGALIALAVMTAKVKHAAALQLIELGIPQLAGRELAARGMNVSCSSQLIDYLAGIGGELGQVERLVGDAVGNLVASFNYIGKLIRSQQAISLAIVTVKTATPANSELVSQLLDWQTAVADQIKQEVDAVVTSLQFGDLASQLLGHTMIQVEALGTALRRTDTPDAGAQRGELSCEPRWIHEGISMAVTAANAATRRKPVVQQGMQRGAIELFSTTSDSRFATGLKSVAGEP